jgi:hypothetical protein
MTDIARARIELMRIARSLTFVDPGTARRLELIVEHYLDGEHESNRQNVLDDPLRGFSVAVGGSWVEAGAD